MKVHCQTQLFEVLMDCKTIVPVAPSALRMYLQTCGRTYQFSAIIGLLTSVFLDFGFLLTFCKPDRRFFFCSSRPMMSVLVCGIVMGGCRVGIFCRSKSAKSGEQRPKLRRAHQEHAHALTFQMLTSTRRLQALLQQLFTMPFRHSAQLLTVVWYIAALYVVAATAGSQQYEAITSLSPSDIEEKLQVARPSFLAHSTTPIPMSSAS